MAFASVIDANQVCVIDLDSNTLLPTAIAVGVNPHTVVVSPDEQVAYVANAGANTVRRRERRGARSRWLPIVRAVPRRHAASGW